MSTEENPYVPPKHGGAIEKPLVGVPGDGRTPFVPASRWRRLGAATIDAVFAWGLLWLLSWMLAKLLWGQVPATPAVPLEQDWRFGVVLAATFGLTLGVQGWLVGRRGQSLGKILMKIRIVHADGRVVGFLRGFLLRTFPFNAIMLLPLAALFLRAPESLARPLNVFTAVATFIDAMWIFGSGARCFHDRLADTFVEKLRAAEVIADADDPERRRRKSRKTVTSAPATGARSIIDAKRGRNPSRRKDESA